MMDYRPIIESKYNRENWQRLLHDIFNGKEKFWATPSVVPTNSQFARQALWLGTITLSDEQTIAVYEVELSESVDIERNRRGIRDMLLTSWRNNGNAGAFMFCYRRDESVLRFSYVSESWNFAEDGTYKKESTDTKRFTYLLGEGHRSRTAIQQFEKLRDSKLSLKDLTKAFSVDAVSDMFFDGYKKQYEDIIQYITGKRMVKVANKWEELIKNRPCEEIMQEFARFQNPEKAVRDYVKKLMGRLVFLQFLQKKGWLGVPVNAEWGSGDAEFIQHLFERTKDKDHFVDNVLEPLFDDLNSERTNNLVSSAVGTYIRVPYLNGGLFEREAADETEFPLPAKYMQSLLDFFASYNFTIDENDPDDAEVGVDPEMLGRIFENLLEDNKDKGAFYTPKEIVSYMCRESLIAYLQTGIKDETTKDAIRQFVTTHDVATLGTNDKFRQQLDEALCNVKICDPAIGSGAFPMGLLKELFQCRTALEGISQHQAAAIKKHIIQQNIYGVDIERGAVDIARLRFWLSLIVDEETPQALPNLDFKIMQGNSLLEQYKGVDLSKTTDITTERQGVVQLTWFDNQLDFLRLDLREKLAKYYDCTDHNEKKELRASIIDNVKKQLTEQSIIVDFGNLDLSGNNQFFLWHTWFYDVFSKGGFDIVIGNPPYLRIQGLHNSDDSLVDILSNCFKSATGSFDFYVCFVETGLNIIDEKGLVNLIMPVKWSNASFGKGLRKLLSASKSANRIINFGEYQVFNASTYTALQWFIPNSESLAYVELNRDLPTNYELKNYLDGLSDIDFSAISHSKLNEDPWVLTVGKINRLLTKLDEQPRRVSDVFEKIFQGLATSKDDVYFLQECTESNGLVTGYSKELDQRVIVEKGLLRPLLKGEDVHRFDTISTHRMVIFPYKQMNGRAELFDERELRRVYPHGYEYLKRCEMVLRNRERGRLLNDDYWYRYIYPKNLVLFNNEKLVAPDISMGGNFALDSDGLFYQTTTIYGYIKKDIVRSSYKALMAILNSELCWWFMQNTGNVMANGYYRYKPAYINPFPIPSDESILSVQSKFESLVDSIIEAKAKGNFDKMNILEKEINRQVYHLYGLTYDEVLIADPETPITREKYELTKK